VWGARVKAEGGGRGVQPSRRRFMQYVSFTVYGFYGAWSLGYGS
jgi:hypothetical protein